MLLPPKNARGTACGSLALACYSADVEASDGDPEGIWDGNNDGNSEGSSEALGVDPDGANEGKVVGSVEGDEEGSCVGPAVCSVEGGNEGLDVGNEGGSLVELPTVGFVVLGEEVGSLLESSKVGVILVGDVEGVDVGLLVGSFALGLVGIEGDSEGSIVGCYDDT